MNPPTADGFYRGKNVLVAGGLGFIGSNVVIALAEAGAKVTVMDGAVAGCGANVHNLASLGEAVNIVYSDIGDVGETPHVLEGVDIVFNLAGEISHIHSMLFPERDLQLNTISQLRFLEAVARFAPHVRVVYSSTRQVYGRPISLPVDEHHPVFPADYNGVHKLTACQYHSLLTRLGRIDAVVLRLSNVFGPRMALSIPCQGFLPVFTAQAMIGAPLTVFGTGEQLRDPMFIDDACEALLRAGMVVAPAERVINVGSPEVRSLAQIAGEFSQLAGLPPPVLRPFPNHLKAIDIGDYYTCNSVCHRVLGWIPRTPFRTGLERTLEYYAGHRKHYIPDNQVDRCPLHSKSQVA